MIDPLRTTVASLLSAAITGLRGAAHTGVLIGEDHVLFGANERARAMLWLDDVPEQGIDWVGLTPPEYRTSDDQAINDAINFGASRWYRKEFFVTGGTRVTVDLLFIATEADPFRWLALLREPESSPLRRAGTALKSLAPYDAADVTFRLARRVAGAGTLRQVLKAVDRLAPAALGCNLVSVALPTEWGTLSIHHDPSVPTDIRDHHEEVGRDITTMVGECFVSGATIHLDIDEYADRYPTLGADAREMGVSHIVAAPMHADDGRIVGVFCPAWRSVADVTDLEHVESIADLIGNAVELATDTERARSMASSFQEMLLPARLAEVNDASVTVRYSAVDRAVGGDFYDVVTGADGRSWFVVGDVAGHGLPASRTMGKIRFFLRAVMRDESDPSRVLSRVHDLLLTEAMDELATCMIGRWDPVARTLTIASAGHLPPITTDTTTSVVPIAPDPPLGTPNVTFTRPNTVIDIVGPMRLLLYTDGVVERRDEIIDESIAALAKRLTTTADQPLEAAADTILDQATSSGEDDMALLLIDFIGGPPVCG